MPAKKSNKNKLFSKLSLPLFVAGFVVIGGLIIWKGRAAPAPAAVDTGGSLHIVCPLYIGAGDKVKCTLPGKPGNHIILNCKKPPNKQIKKICKQLIQPPKPVKKK